MVMTRSEAMISIIFSIPNAPRVLFTLNWSIALQILDRDYYID